MEINELTAHLMKKVVDVQSKRSKIGVFNIFPKGYFELLGYDTNNISLEELKSSAMWFLKDLSFMLDVAENVVNEVEPNFEETEND